MKRLGRIICATMAVYAAIGSYATNANSEEPDAADTQITEGADLNWIKDLSGLGKGILEALNGKMFDSRDDFQVNTLDFSSDIESHLYDTNENYKSDDTRELRDMTFKALGEYFAESPLGTQIVRYRNSFRNVNLLRFRQALKDLGNLMYEKPKQAVFGIAKWEPPEGTLYIKPQKQGRAKISPAFLESDMSTFNPGLVLEYPTLYGDISGFYDLWISEFGTMFELKENPILDAVSASCNIKNKEYSIEMRSNSGYYLGADFTAKVGVETDDKVVECGFKYEF